VSGDDILANFELYPRYYGMDYGMLVAFTCFFLVVTYVFLLPWYRKPKVLEIGPSAHARSREYVHPAPADDSVLYMRDAHSHVHMALPVPE